MTVRPLTIDASRCDGVGICAIAARDLITLDEWGFPVLTHQVDGADPRPPGRWVERQAAAAARACPHRAIVADVNLRVAR